jgi:hypothetical protein
MASTRFRDDQARKEDQLRQSTMPCDYIMNAPGNGPTPPFMEDPHIRLQKWGANLASNYTSLETSLMGIRQSHRDCLGKDEYNKPTISVDNIQYPSNSLLTTGQPRATNPAWELRDNASERFGEPTFVNPQSNIFQPFNINTSTRILEKDYYNEKNIRGPLSTFDLLPNHHMNSKK